MLKALLLGCCNWETVKPSDGPLRGPWVTGGGCPGRIMWPLTFSFAFWSRGEQFCSDMYSLHKVCYQRSKAVGWQITDWGPKLTFSLCMLITQVHRHGDGNWVTHTSYFPPRNLPRVTFTSHCSENLLSRVGGCSCSFWAAHRQRFNTSYFSLQPALASLFDSFSPLLSPISQIFPHSYLRHNGRLLWSL